MSTSKQEQLISRIEAMRNLAQKEYSRYWELHTMGRRDEADLKFREWQHLNSKINHLKSLLNIEQAKN